MSMRARAKPDAIRAARLAASASVAAMLFLAATGISAAATNPLLGTWVYAGNGYVDRDGTDWCAFIPKMIFTATDQTMFAAATKFKPAAQGTTPVTYLVSGKNVYVSQIGNFNGAPLYTMTSADTMETSNVGTCIFKRQ
jgi:hypothetical protein